MSVYYPQASLTLRVRWEDFGNEADAKLQSVYSLPIVARRISVNINDYTQADTFEAEIDYKQFPFDPRSIRACGVTVSMQDMKKVFQGSALEQIKPNAENTIFLGFADEESIVFDDDKRVVKLEGRDFTSLLIDRKYLRGPIDLTKKLDTLLTEILADLAEVAEIKLDNRVPGELPVLGKFATQFTSAAQKKNVKLDENYWEVIQDLVGRAGLIAYIELDKLVLSTPRVLYDRNKAKRFIYGRNIKDLEFKRKLGRKKNFNVLVRSLNVDKKEVLEAEIPKEASDTWARDTGVPQRRIQIPVINADGSPGTPKDAPIIALRVANVADKPQLVKIGEQIYEELGRQQIEGSFKTREMETKDVQNVCFNLMKLRNGTPLQIDIDQGDLNGVNRIDSVSKKAQFLVSRCYDRKVAQVLAETLSNPRFNGPFYTKAVQFTLDSESGMEIKVDFINFIELPPQLAGA